MKVKIDGIGSFDVNESCLPMLMEFLTKNSAVKLNEDATVREKIDGKFSGRELLNG